MSDEHFFSYHLYEGLMEVKPATYSDESKVKMNEGEEQGEFRVELKNFTGVIIFSETSKILESSTESDDLGTGSGLSKPCLKGSAGSTPVKIKKESVEADVEGHYLVELNEAESPAVAWDADCDESAAGTGTGTGKKKSGRYSIMSLESVPYKGGRESVLSTFSDDFPPQMKEEGSNSSEIDSELDDEFGETQQEDFNF
jgi:hypothetical protein